MVDILGTLQQGASAIESGLSSAPGYLSTIAQQAFQPPPLPSTPNIPPPPSTFTPPALPQLPQQQPQMRRRIDEPFNSFVSNPSTNINMPNTMDFNRPVPSPAINRLDMPEPTKNQPSFQPTPSIPVMNKPEMAVTSTLTKPSSISLDFKTMDQTQKPPGVFENANKFVRETTQVEKIIPTWEDTFGGIADKATGKYPNTSGKQSDLTYTEQLKVWTSGDKGYTKFVAPTTQKESDNFDPKLGIDKYRTETYKAPEGFLRDVAVPFTKKLWDLPRDEPVTAAIYYSTPLINAGIPMAAGKILQAPVAAPLLNALNNPVVYKGLDIGSKALLGATVAQQGAYVAGYDPSNPFSAPLSQKPKDISERSVTAMVNVVPMFAFTKGLQKIPNEIDDVTTQLWKERTLASVSPELTPVSAKTFTHQEMIDKINAPIAANQITMSPNEPSIISEGSKLAHKSREYATTLVDGKVLGRVMGEEGSVQTLPLTQAAAIHRDQDPFIKEFVNIHNHPTQFYGNKATVVPGASGADVHVAFLDASRVPELTKNYVASEKGLIGFQVINAPKNDMIQANKLANDLSDTYVRTSKKNIGLVSDAPDFMLELQSKKPNALSWSNMKKNYDYLDNEALLSYDSGDTERAAQLLENRDLVGKVLAQSIENDAKARPIAMNYISDTFQMTKPLRTLPIDVPFYMRKPKKSKPKIKTNKKPIKRGSLYEKKTKEQIHEILSNRKQVEQIEMPFKAQQVTGSPQQKMGVWLQPFAKEPNEHYIIASQTGDFIASKEGLPRHIPSYIINNALDKAEEITGKHRSEAVWTHLHNHPANLNIPSDDDNEAFITLNIRNRYNKLGTNLAPDRYGIIGQKSARILTYPDKGKTPDNILGERISGRLIYQTIRDKHKPSGTISAFNEYSKVRDIDNEIIDFDYKPLYKSRKKKSKKPKVNLGIKLPSIKLPTFKKIKSKKQ